MSYNSSCAQQKFRSKTLKQYKEFTKNIQPLKSNYFSIFSEQPSSSKINLTSEQINILSQIEQSIISVSDRQILKAVLGVPGSGKSVLLKALCQKLKHHSVNFAVTAPTGVSAASLPDAQTNHSYFSIPVTDECNFENLAQYSKIPKDTLNKFSKVQWWICDEISFVSAATFSLISKLFQKAKRRTQPFGNTNVVVF
jgi:Cdc6-like AAA superfamily ATPase